MVTLFSFTKHNKDKMLILAHRKMNVLYVWLVSSKYMYRLQSCGYIPITSGSPHAYDRKKTAAEDSYKLVLQQLVFKSC